MRLSDSHFAQFRMGQLTDDNHREDTLHFTFPKLSHLYLEPKSNCKTVRREFNR